MREFETAYLQDERLRIAVLFPPITLALATHSRYKLPDLMTWRKLDDTALGDTSNEAMAPRREVRRKVCGGIRRG